MLSYDFLMRGSNHYPLTFKNSSQERSSCRGILCQVEILDWLSWAHIFVLSYNPCNGAPREARKKNEDVFEKLPLFEIEDLYGKTEAGRRKTYVGFGHSTLLRSCSVLIL